MFQIRPPFSEPMIFLAGTETNHWAHRRGRMYLRARDYFVDFEKVYGAAGCCPRSTARTISGCASPCQRPIPAEAGGQMDELYGRARTHMAQWKVGDTYPATGMSRRMINSQISPFMVGVETQDIIDDLLKFKERALSVHIMKIMPPFMLKTPGMRRRVKFIETLLERIQSVHTPAQRLGRHPDSWTTT